MTVTVLEPSPPSNSNTSSEVKVYVLAGGRAGTSYTELYVKSTLNNKYYIFSRLFTRIFEPGTAPAEVSWILPLQEISPEDRVGAEPPVFYGYIDTSTNGLFYVSGSPERYIADVPSDVVSAILALRPETY